MEGDSGGKESTWRVDFRAKNKTKHVHINTVPETFVIELWLVKYFALIFGPAVK